MRSCPGLQTTPCVWNTVTGECLQNCRITLVGESVSFSGDGKRIVSGSNDGTVRVWDAEYGFCLHELKGILIG